MTKCVCVCVGGGGGGYLLVTGARSFASNEVVNKMYCIVLYCLMNTVTDNNSYGKYT